MFTNVTILFLEPNNEYNKNAIIVKSNLLGPTCCRSTARKVVSSDERMKLYKVTATITGLYTFVLR